MQRAIFTPHSAQGNSEYSRVCFPHVTQLFSIIIHLVVGIRSNRVKMVRSRPGQQLFFASNSSFSYALALTKSLS